MRTALRVGWRAGVGRGRAAVGADRRGQGGGAWRGGLVPPVFRGLGVARAPRPALQRLTRRCGRASPGFRPWRRRRTRAGQGRGPSPKRTPTRRSPPGRRGRRQAWAGQGSSTRRRGPAPRLSTVRRPPSPTNPPESSACVSGRTVPRVPRGRRGRSGSRLRQAGRAGGGGGVRTGDSRGVFRRLGRLRERLL